MSEPDEDFAAMFEASLKAKRFERGQTIEGTIVAIGPGVAFVDVGGKGEAQIEIEELKDADGDIEVAVGDRIQAVVVSTSGGLTLSRKLARGAATDRQLEDAFHARLPVEGKVEKAVKGGYEVRIGRQRGFCPISQIDTNRADPSTHEGRVYAFRIIEHKEGGRNLVVSRRAILEEEQKASAAQVRESIVAGAVMTGRVTSVREFGASWTWVAACRACFTCPRWGGPACRIPRKSRHRARRSPSRSCASTTTSRRSLSG